MIATDVTAPFFAPFKLTLFVALFAAIPWILHQIWGFADDLLREIDDKYALAPSKQTYEYQVRNRTTSNVHLMLNSALNEIIDKSECLIFLNTKKSVYTDKNLYDEKTYTASPWIMSELYFSSLNVCRQLFGFAVFGYFRQ